MAAGGFEAVVRDPRAVLRTADVHDGCERRKGSKTHIAVDAIERLHPLHVARAVIVQGRPWRACMTSLPAS